ncbi:MAG: DUF1826 domain-containing protein [Pseudomonadota bacterium]
MSLDQPLPAVSPAPAAPAGAAPAGVTFVDSRDALAAIAEPACAGAVWPRALPAEVSAWLDALPAERLPNGRLKTLPSEARAAAAELFDAAGAPDDACRVWLIEDVAALADRFARLMGAERLLLRLQVVTSNACRKFHVDAVTARLICTYRGTGTQVGTSPDLANRADPPQIVTVPSGAPLILRGTLWPETPASALLHRSPPIEGTGETRLLLVLDPFDPEIHG